MMKKVQSRGLVVLIIMFFSIIFFSSIDNEKLNRIFDLYNQDLEQVIMQSKIQNTYESFVNNIEMRLNILTSEWEKDRMLILTGQVFEGMDEEDKEIVNEAYENWGKEAEQKVVKAKAEYLSKDIDINELNKGIEATKEQLISQFDNYYAEIKERIRITESVKLDRSGLMTIYQENGYSEFEKKLNEWMGVISNFFDEKKKEKEQIAQMYGIDIAILGNSFDKEKERIIVEKKRMLSAIYNTYMYRISQMILADQDSLRINQEKERAKAVAKEIEQKVNEELSTSINEKLDNLLSSEVLSEEDLSNLSAELAFVYKQGLEIWAKAAVELVENEKNGMKIITRYIIME